MRERERCKRQRECIGACVTSKFLIDSECGCEGDRDVCMRVFGRVSGGVRILSLDGDSDDE